MKFIPLTSDSSDLFVRCWALYESAFPDIERRDVGYQLETLKCEEYHFDAVMDGDMLVGFVGWWDFPDIIYVEHFAILSDLRNGGYGRRILEMIKSLGSGMILLEVEHPDEEMARRRVKFYEREGFVLNQYEYIHPPYRGEEPVSLLVMTYPKEISQRALDEFKMCYFPKIHFR